jgi:Sigma-70 region 2
MMTGGQNEDEEGADEKEAGSAAIKATDAAVRRALIESRRDLLNFVYRRLGHRADAEDVLQRFSLRAIALQSFAILVRCAVGSVASSRPR